ncbi:MAG: S8 family serine peptidase [Armatimonadetes bacterium]|nr:S8 family serine peptidase [Armatimonadota bacterium]
MLSGFLEDRQKVMETLFHHRALHASGLTGRGVGLAVVDTGIFHHPDISGRVVEFLDPAWGSRFCYDNEGHGTSIATVACGNGKASRGRIMGLAPEAHLVGIKVAGKEGYLSGKHIQEGLEWLLENHWDYGIRVVNMSFSISRCTCGTCESEDNVDRILEIVDQLAEEGVIPVVASGRGLMDMDEMGVLALSPSTLAVGAMDDRFHKVLENRWGVSDADHRRMKPDVMAPASDVPAGGKDGGYFPMLGTSIGAAIVSGILCQWLQACPELDLRDVRMILARTGKRLSEIPSRRQGYGLPDPMAGAAIAHSVALEEAA